MAIAVITSFPGTTTEQYDEAIEAMGLTAGGRHPGAMFHWVARTEDGLRVTDVWRSRDDWEAFLQEQVIPATQQLGFPEPEVTYVDVHNYMTGA
jgi:hypothetical protein